MTRGAFAADSGRVVGAARDATRALTRVAKEMEARRRTRLEGASVVEVVEELMASGGRELRLKCAEAFLEYEQAISVMRAGVVRSLVDDAELTLTEAARRLQISRQAAARLYQQAAEEPDDPQSVIIL